MTSRRPGPQFQLLGPVTVLTAGGPVPLGGGRQRALLALLLLDAGRVVSVERIVDQLWPGSPPAGAAKTVRSYVSRLRTALRTDAVQAVAGGYRFEVDDDSVDARRFERLLGQGRELLREGSAGLAAERLHAALALWRGPALAGAADGGALEVEARRLDELHLACLEERIEADLALGREAALVAELRTLVSEAPLRERLWAQLALALYRCGRQGEALASLREARDVLDRELGVAPGEQLRELEVAILRQQVPGTAEATRYRLPAPTTGFVGREGETSALENALREHRLITITGLGGVGKTRLACELARRQDQAWADGACLAELAGLAADSDPALVAGAVAGALDIADRVGEHPLDAVVAHLTARELLLVLDNCEHLVEVCAQLTETLLAGCPNVRILATSRTPLAVPGEVDFALDPLPTPPELADEADLAAAPAVRLFLQRAGDVAGDLSREPAVRPPALDAVARICRELDGLPLAIELAAARSKSLSPGEIADRLGDRFRFLRAWQRVRDPRHRTLATAMDWSYDLLDDDERGLLARLSVFAGGATLATVAEVCVHDDLDAADVLLGRLVDASLVRAETGEPTRYRMLETVRQYAAGKLATADAADADENADAVRRAHAEYFLALAESANLSIEALGQGEQRPEIVLAEQHNLRAAIDWATESDPPLAARLLLALENFWTTQAVAEGERRLALLLDRADGLDPLTRARLTRDHAGTLDIQADRDRARAGYLRSRELFAAAGDPCGVAYLDFRLGLLAMVREDLAEARALWLASLDVFREHGDAIGELQVLGNLGELEYLFGDRERGASLLEASIAKAEQLGWWWFAAGFTSVLAVCAVDDGQGDDADTRGRRMLRLADRAGDRQLSLHALAILARAAALRGDADRALTLWSTVATTEDAPGRIGRFDRDGFAAGMPPGPLPDPLPLEQAVAVALAPRRQ